MTEAGDGLGACAEPLARVYDTVLLDLDGVVYLGAEQVPGAADAVAAIREGGMGVAFVTNNAARTPADVAERLRRYGIAATADDVVTAAQAAAGLLADKLPAGAPVLVVGGEGLHAALRERGLRPVTSAEDDPAAVVQGYTQDLEYAQLAEGALALRAGAMYVASNLDRTLPSDRGPLPGNGSLVQVLRHATGVEPIAAGKPEPRLYQEAIGRVAARRPLVVGDRLDTDIAGAVRAGVDSMLVLTGVTAPDALLGAASGCRPTYVAADLTGLLRPHPPARPDGGGWTCGGWTAAVRDGALELAGSGGYEDGLRALCAAAWAAGQLPDPAAALARLEATTAPS